MQIRFVTDKIKSASGFYVQYDAFGGTGQPNIGQCSEF